MRTGGRTVSRRGAALLAMSVLAAALSARGADVAVDLDASMPIDPTSGDHIALAAGARVYHLVFFATWCRPCFEEFGLLSDLEARWGQQDYRLYLVAVPTRQNGTRLAAFVRDQKPPGRVVLDADGELTRLLGVDAIPTHCILDAAGRVVHEAERFEDGVYDAVSRTIHRVSTGKAP